MIARLREGVPLTKWCQAPAHHPALAHAHEELRAREQVLSRPGARPLRRPPPLLGDHLELVQESVQEGLDFVQEQLVHGISTPGSANASSSVPSPPSRNSGHV